MDNNKLNEVSKVKEKVKQMERASLLHNSEYDQQKALLTQRVEYLERNLEDSVRKENVIYFNLFLNYL